MKKLSLIVLTLLILTSCAESTQPNEADYRNRKVEVYSYNGGLIKSWEGKFDVKEVDRNSVYFDDFDRNSAVYFDYADGKRVIISGGIIIEEIK